VFFYCFEARCKPFKITCAGGGDKLANRSAVASALLGATFPRVETRSLPNLPASFRSVLTTGQPALNIIKTPTAYPVISESGVDRSSSLRVDQCIETVIDITRVTASAFDQPVPIAIGHAAKAVLTNLSIGHWVPR
jgi:hypothetical protein